MKPIQEKLKEKPWLGWVIFFLTVLVVFMLGMLASSIVQRRAEAVFAYTPAVTFSEYEPRNSVWGNYSHVNMTHILKLPIQLSEVNITAAR